jgi:hypothetical protein
MTEPDEVARSAAREIAAVLAPNGRLVSVEYFASTAQHWWWLRVLNDAGLSIAWDRSALVRLEGEPDAPSGAMLVSATRANHVRVARLDDYFASALVSKLEAAGRRTTFVGELAEVLFAVISEKSLLRGFEAVYPLPPRSDGVPVSECDELWEAGPLLLSRRTSNIGDRRLELRSALAVDAALDELERFAALLAGEYGALVRWHGDVRR